jgi:3-oxoacyl-[acyl-carrier-protein] synthase-3
MTRAQIIGIGAYAPKRILTNEDLERMVETSSDWIVQRTGIRERHVVDENEATSDLAIRAAQQALERAEVEPGGSTYRGGHHHRRHGLPHHANVIGISSCRNAGSMDMYARLLGIDLQPVVGSVRERQIPDHAPHRRGVPLAITDYTDRGTCILSPTRRERRPSAATEA